MEYQDQSALATKLRGVLAEAAQAMTALRAEARKTTVMAHRTITDHILLTATLTELAAEHLERVCSELQLTADASRMHDDVMDTLGRAAGAAAKTGKVLDSANRALRIVCSGLPENQRPDTFPGSPVQMAAVNASTALYDAAQQSKLVHEITPGGLAEVFGELHRVTSAFADVLTALRPHMTAATGKVTKKASGGRSRAAGRIDKAMEAAERHAHDIARPLRNADPGRAA